MSVIKSFKAQNAQLQLVLDQLIAGEIDPVRAQAIVAAANSVTRKEEARAKRAVLGGYVDKLTPEWVASDVTP